MYILDYYNNDAPRWRQALYDFLKHRLAAGEFAIVGRKYLKWAFPMSSCYGPEPTADLNTARDWARPFGWHLDHDPSPEGREREGPLRFTRL